jgi:hypothetical protein
MTTTGQASTDDATTIAPVDPDFPLTPVPRSARRSVVSISVVRHIGDVTVTDEDAAGVDLLETGRTPAR